MDALSLIRLQQTQNTRIDTVTNEVELARPSVAGVQHQTLKERLDAMEGSSNGLDGRVQAVEKEINDAKGGEPTLQGKLDKIEQGITDAINGLSWKATVATVGDLTTSYPNAEEGWCANVEADGCLYRFTAGQWIKISSNAIPKADGQTDGLMSKEHYTKLENMPEGNKIITTDGDQTINGSLEATGGFTGDLTGNATTATTATTAEKVANKLTISIDGIETEYDGSQAQRIDIASANHEHSSDKITAMTGYDKGQAGATPILVGDSLNTAIGKLENGLDGKAESNHVHTGADIALTGYNKGTADPITEADTVNEAIGKLEAGLDGKAEAGHEHNYAGSAIPGGPANSAVKLETARTIELIGNVTGQADFDGSGNIQINTTIVGGGKVTLTSTLEHKRVDQTGPTITVTLAGYDSVKDVLRVYSSGMLLRPNYHYTISNAGDDYTFTATANANNQWIVGEEMTFEVIKASL